MVKIEDNDCGDENEDFDWSSEDDREIESYTSAPNSRLVVPVMGSSTAEKASSSNSVCMDFFHRFIDMGYSDKLVEKVIEENGDKTFEQILDMLCTYSTLESFPEGNSDVDSDFWSSDDNDNKLDSDSCWSGNEGNGSALSINDETISRLVDMGYTAEEAAIAVDRCGSEASVFVLTDFIFAAQKSKVQDSFYPEEEKPRRNLFCEMGSKKRKLIEKDLKQKKHRDLFENELIRLPKPMIGFGVPTVSSPPYRRTLPEVAIADPYFYYENVALAPKGVWDTKKSFLYDVKPEFVDSKFFSAANRKRGYIHNLPLDNRRPVLPLAAQTIQEALPMTEKWWPTWDTRSKLNCLQTCIASARLTNSIRNLLEAWDGLPPLHVQKKILKECKKWNLVWVGKNKVAPLECDEMEMLLGFPKNHTRGGGISRTDRYKSLGNSFQVDTVAYHLSPLKDEFPQGINVLSLFSGIGGAEVALHRLGIKLNTVVSVEKSAVNRNIVRDFWEQTNQTGNLIDFDDVQKVTKDKLEQIMKRYGEFNLVIGGSPCNNLAGSNRHHRDGLKGKESSLFFEYHRILDVVRCWVKISRGGLC